MSLESEFGKIGFDLNLLFEHFVLDLHDRDLDQDLQFEEFNLNLLSGDLYTNINLTIVQDFAKELALIVDTK